MSVYFGSFNFPTLAVGWYTCWTYGETDSLQTLAPASSRPWPGLPHIPASCHRYNVHIICQTCTKRCKLANSQLFTNIWSAWRCSDSLTVVTLPWHRRRPAPRIIKTNQLHRPHSTRWSGDTKLWLTSPLECHSARVRAKGCPGPSWQPPKHSTTLTIRLYTWPFKRLRAIIIISRESANIHDLIYAVLTCVLIRDLIETVLKHLIEVHGLILRASHLGHTDNIQ